MVIANIPGMNLTDLNVRHMRLVYRTTYNQANLEKCPDRKTVAEFILKAFGFKSSMVKSTHWEMCRRVTKMIEITTTCVSRSTRI